MAEGPSTTLDKLGMPRDKLTGRLEALGPGEVLMDPRLGTRASFVEAYKGRQWGLIRAALEELTTRAR